MQKLPFILLPHFFSKFLSCSKLALTSIMLLTPTELFNRTGSVVGLVLLYDDTIDYFSTKHLPLAVAAIIVLIIFVRTSTASCNDSVSLQVHSVVSHSL